MTKRFDEEIKVVEAIMQDQTMVHIDMPLYATFMVLNTLQLAYSNPRLAPETREMVRAWGQTFQAWIASYYPGAEKLIEEGWTV